MAKIFRQHDDDEALRARETEVALDPKTLLGQEVMRQFRMAVMNKHATRVGDYHLTDLLQECHDARDDRTLRCEYDIKDKYPEWASMPINLVGFKVNILTSLIRESLVDVASAPFIVDITPIATIPEDKRQEILEKALEEVKLIGESVAQEKMAIIQQLSMQGVPLNEIENSPSFPKFSPEQLIDLLTRAKIKGLQEVTDHAKEQAIVLQKALYDKTTEGGYKQAIKEFSDDFATYPFACIHGPVPMIKVESVWKGSKFKEEKRVSWGFERISPFDLFWTNDSTNTQDGTAVFIRKRVPYDYLYDARQLGREDKNSGYDPDVINELMETAREGKIPRMWADYIFETNPEYSSTAFSWTRGENIDILIRYGRLLGSDLLEWGFLDLDEEIMYETKIIMCGGQVIMCQINNSPAPYKRPVFTASFESRNNSIVGVGLGQKLLSLHKAYRAIIHLMMYNLGLSSEPITEVEVNRILQYMPEEWVEEPVITPGMVIPADGDRMGNSPRAIKFTQIPSTTESCLRVANYIFELAHSISNIPAALHGQPVGSGANRTVRGLLTLQGNTLKPIHSAMMNLDVGIIEPMVTKLYKMLVMYDKDFEYSGDCKIVAKGAASMVQREIEKQTAVENLQTIATFGDTINPDIRNRVVANLLRTAGILEPGENPFNPIPSQQPMPPQAQPQQAPPETTSQPQS